MKKVIMDGKQFENMVDLVALSLLSDQLSDLDLSQFPQMEEIKGEFCNYVRLNIESLMKSQGEIIE